MGKKIWEYIDCISQENNLNFFKFFIYIRMNLLTHKNNTYLQWWNAISYKIIFITYHFVPMIDSTLKEIVDFFSKQDPFLATEISLWSFTAEVKLLKLFFILRGSVTCSNHGIVEYILGKDCIFFESSDSCLYSWFCDIFNNGASAVTIIKECYQCTMISNKK